MEDTYRNKWFLLQNFCLSNHYRDYVLSALRAYFAKSGETGLLNERATLDAIRDARKRTNNGIERQREDGIQL